MEQDGQDMNYPFRRFCEAATLFCQRLELDYPERGFVHALHPGGL